MWKNCYALRLSFVTLSFIFRLLLSSAAFFHSSPGGRRCGVHEADCRGIGRTIPCVLGDRPRPLWDSVPCIKSHASARQLVIHFVTGQMVGDRRFSEAAMLGGEFFHFFRQPSFVCPADWSRTSRRLVVWAVFEMEGAARSDGCNFLSIVLSRRCGVLVASCCGSGSPLGLDVAASMADCCVGNNSGLARRCGVAISSLPVFLHFFLASDKSTRGIS